MCAASLGLTKTSINGIIEDEGVSFIRRSDDEENTDEWIDSVLDMGGYDIKEELFQPLQTLLEQCKTAKNVSRFVCPSLSM